MRYYSSDSIRKAAAVYNVIMGQRSHGKTYDMGHHIVSQFWEALKRGQLRQAAYIRQQERDLMGHSAETALDCLCHNGDGKNAIEELTEGKYNSIRYYRRAWYLEHRDDETGKVSRCGDPFMLGFALSQYMHDKGGSYPYVTDIWFEEFMQVSERGYLPNEFKIFQNVISTIARKRPVTIWLTGNTMDPYCPYFQQMGLHRVRQQKPGTIEIYKLGKSGKKIAVEITSAGEEYETAHEGNDYLFAFDNPELRMITSGGWEIKAYPLLETDLNPRDVCGTAWLLYQGERLQLDVVSNGSVAYLYIHKGDDPLVLPDSDVDLIYSPEYDMRPNWRRSINTPQSDAERVIANLIRCGKIYYDDNVTGNTWDSYVKWCRTA